MFCHIFLWQIENPDHNITKYVSHLQIPLWELMDIGLHLHTHYIIGYHFNKCDYYKDVAASAVPKLKVCFPSMGSSYSSLMPAIHLDTPSLVFFVQEGKSSLHVLLFSWLYAKCFPFSYSELLCHPGRLC